MSYLISKSGLSSEGQNVVCDIARRYIERNLNPHQLTTDISPTPSDHIVFYEKYDSRTNTYEGEVLDFLLQIDEDCVITIIDTATGEEYRP